MTTKRRSFPKCSHDIGNCDWNISCSSSDSDDHYSHSNSRKKFKSKVGRWIKTECVQKHKIPNDINDGNVRIDNDTFTFYSESGLFSNEILETNDDSLKPATSAEHNFHESPVIGRLKLEELSPILKSSVEKIQSSPIIERKLSNQNVKRILIKDEDDTKITFSTQSSHVIIDSKSPSFTENCVIITSTQSSQNSINLSIDAFSSQQSTDIFSNSDSTKSSSNNNSSSYAALYPALSSKKKIKYKKGGIAYQLQKALNKQKTNYAIWNHELYLQKSKGYEIASPHSDNLILSLQIRMFWKEFGVTVIECEILDNITKKEINEREYCLVLLGFSAVHQVRLKLNSKLKLHPPYKTKIIKYKNKVLPCHFNILKVLGMK